MGTQGTRTRFPRGLVFDAGALIAVERGDRPVATIVEDARDLGIRIFIPASALAQAWRGGPGGDRLARLLKIGEVDPLDEERAKEVGVRLGLRDQADITDAHVVCCALTRDSTVATSDEEDIHALMGSGERLPVLAV